jgi:sulfhydrogenase subunit alpha
VTEHDLALRVPTLTRVEGEGALHVTLADGRVDDVQLRIYEAPRFFEALLRGRSYLEPVDITARICGICPVAYQLSAATAMERMAGVQVDDGVRALRRLMYCGEWIGSHVLHIVFLHAPDFLGAASGIELAGAHRELVTSGLELKKLGNDLMALLGGRAIHPVNLRVGGLHHTPAVADLRAVRERLAWAHRTAVDLVRWTSGLTAPAVSTDHVLVSLRDEDGYPIDGGRVVSDHGLDIDVAALEEHVEEHQVPWSNALHGRLADGSRYLTGPLARWANNHDRAPAEVRDLAAEVGIGPVERNPFRSIVVRALEVLIAVIEAERIVDEYVEPARPYVEVPPRAGIGWGATEAPRGVLYHRYVTDADGTIRSARIIPPTAQNQPAIEHDVRRVVEEAAAAGDLLADQGARDALTHRCETAIRNHDPCISCATHFLALRVEERGHG